MTNTKARAKKTTRAPRALTFAEVREAIARAEARGPDAAREGEAKRDLRIWRCFMDTIGMKGTNKSNTASLDPTSGHSASSALARGVARDTASPCVFSTTLFLPDWNNTKDGRPTWVEQYFAFCIVENAGANGRITTAYQCAHGHPGKKAKSITPWSLPAGDLDSFRKNIGAFSRAMPGRWYPLPDPKFADKKTNLLALAQIDGASDAMREAAKILVAMAEAKPLAVAGADPHASAEAATAGPVGARRL